MKEKMRSTSGASIVLALLVFMICAMIGSSVIAAASASSGTITDTYAEDKDVYLLKSAGTLVSDAFQDVTFTANTYDKGDGTLKVASPASIDTLYSSMSASIYNKSAKTSDPSLQEEFNMTLTDGSVVHASIVMDSTYSVTGVFTMDNSKRTLQIYMAASTFNGTTIQEKGTSVTWGEAVISIS